MLRIFSSKRGEKIGRLLDFFYEKEQKRWVKEIIIKKKKNKKCFDIISGLFIQLDDYSYYNLFIRNIRNIIAIIIIKKFIM